MKIVRIDESEYQQEEVYFHFLFNKLIYLNTVRSDSEIFFYKIIDDKNKKRFIFYFLKNLNQDSADLVLPYSSPYWILESIRKEEQPERYVDGVSLIIDLLKKKFNTVTITLPPLMYDERHIALVLKAFIDKGFKVNCLDYNHYLDIACFDVLDYNEKLDSNSRRNLKISHNSGLVFKKLTKNEYSDAYQVIKKNRKSKNYPLKVEQEQMVNNLINFKGDVFAVYHDSVMIASAMIFNINERASQLIYWGDIPESYRYKPMNFLAFELLKYYKNSAIDLLDLGPSSDKGVINNGLSNFKESVGAKSSLKFTLNIKLN